MSSPTPWNVSKDLGTSRRLADEFEARADAQVGNEVATGLSTGAKED
jgi:hypothetical protein